MMVPSSYLRVYQPLASFDPEEQQRWTQYIASKPQLPLEQAYQQVPFGSDPRMGMLFPAAEEHAFLKKVSGQWLVCPWRNRLRVLVGLLAFRNSLPEGADAWIPEDEAMKAAEELEAIRSAHPEVRPNIITSSWHVPLRWFIAFDDSERSMTETTTSAGPRMKVTYETDLRTAKTRLNRGLRILREAGMAESQCGPVAEVLDWLTEFSYDSVVELDYGTIAGLFDEQELRLDRSAGEIWSCLEALALGDYEESADRYNDLASWWNRVKSLESAN